MGSALYQNLFRGKKKDTDTRVNWSENPIPEKDKVKQSKSEQDNHLRDEMWGGCLGLFPKT